MNQLTKSIISDLYQEFKGDSGIDMFKKELDMMPITTQEKLAFVELFRESTVAAMNTCFDLMIEEIRKEGQQKKH